MRFKLGPVPDSVDFDTSAPWRPLDEPSPDRLKKIAGPVALLTALLVVLLWSRATDLHRLDWLPAMLTAIAWLPGALVVHEAIHAVLHPRFGASPDSVIGFWREHGFFYAAYLGELSRERLICILLGPLAVISLLPLVYALATGNASAIIVSVSVVNTLASCGDLVGAYLLLRGVPARARVRNQGWRTYWAPRAFPPPGNASAHNDSAVSDAPARSGLPSNGPKVET